MIAITWAQRCAYGNDRCRGIISHLVSINANKKGDTVPFINNLEIIKIFKDEDRGEGISIMDFIN